MVRGPAAAEQEGHARGKNAVLAVADEAEAEQRRAEKEKEEGPRSVERRGGDVSPNEPRIVKAAQIGPACERPPPPLPPRKEKKKGGTHRGAISEGAASEAILSHAGPIKSSDCDKSGEDVMRTEEKTSLEKALERSEAS